VNPVDQTVFQPPLGDCFRACVASVFELPLDAVPNFCGDHREQWFDACRRWLHARGFDAVLLVPEILEQSPPPQGVCIVSGKSPRGDWLHSVVYVDGKPAHDPHPSRAFVAKIQDVLLFLAIDPAAAAKEPK